LTTIEKEELLTTGIAIIDQLLKDENVSVRIGLIERLKSIHELLGTENVKKHVIPIIISCQQDKKWRFRLSVVENLPILFKNLGYDSFKDSIEAILKGFLKDHYFAVR
jgi:serine/threonine-protein phosphatase 2A regulatory subunit A